MLNMIFLMAQQPQDGAAQGNPWSFWIMMAMLCFVFYFFMIRPQQKKQKELQEQRNAMKKGDKVVTAGGIYGEIKEVQENTILIMIAKDVTIKVDKASVYASADDAAHDNKEQK